MHSLDFTPEQKKVLDSKAINIIVSACAGSGKSTILVEKAICESIESKGWKKISILTYTNKSKNDLLDKIKNNSLVTVSTFHGFIYENIFPFDNRINKDISENYIKKSNSYDQWLKELYINKKLSGSNGKSDYVIQHALNLMQKKNLQNYLKSKFHAIYIRLLS